MEKNKNKIVQLKQYDFNKVWQLVYINQYTMLLLDRD